MWLLRVMMEFGGVGILCVLVLFLIVMELVEDLVFFGFVVLLDV